MNTFMLSLRPVGIFCLMVLVVSLGSVGCYQEVTDTPQHPTYDGKTPPTVNGVRPGMTISEVVSILGEPARTTGATNNPTYSWRQPAQVSVTFGGAGRALDIFGTSMNVPKRSLIWSGASEEEVIQILGAPAKKQKSYRPKGSGVISIGSELVGVTLVYQIGGTRFEIYVSDDFVKSVRATAGTTGNN